MKLTQAVLFAVATADDKKVRNIYCTLILEIVLSFLKKVCERRCNLYTNEAIFGQEVG